MDDDGWTPVGDQGTASPPPQDDGWTPIQSAAPQDDGWTPVSQEPETSAAGTFVKSAARAALPTGVGAAGILPGAEAGAMLGTAAAPFLGPLAPIAPVAGGIIGGIGGFMAAGGAAQAVQDKLADAMGVDSAQERTAEGEQHPWAETAGSLLPSLPTFGVEIGGKIVSRLLSGAAMGGFNVGQQAINKGPSNIDWGEAGIAAGVGTALKTGVGGRPEAAQAAIDARLPVDTMARKDGNENAATDPEAQQKANPVHPVASPAVGVAFENTPPAEARADPAGVQTGDGFTSVVTPPTPPKEAAESDQSSTAIGAPSSPEATITDPTRGMDPAVESALGVKAAAEAPASPQEQPTAPTVPSRAPPQVNPAAPPQVNPATSLPGEDIPPFLRRGPQAPIGELPLVGGEAAPRMPEQPLNGENDIQGAPARGQPGYQPTFPSSDISLPKERAPDYTLGQAADIMAGKKPAPQSLSGGATPEGERTFTSATKAAIAKGNIFDAIKNFGPVKWFNQAVNIAGRSENTEQMARITRGVQGENNQDFAVYKNNMNDLAGAANKASPEDRSEAVNTFQTGIPKENALGPFGSSAVDAQKSINVDLAKYDPEGTWQKNFLPRMFQDVEGVKNWMIDREEKGQTSVPTVGEIRDAGYGLRSDVLRQDGTPDFLRTIQAYHLNVQRFLEPKKLIDTGTNDPTHPIFFNNDMNGSLKPLDGITKGATQLYAEPDVATMFNRYIGANAEDVTDKNFWQAAQKVKNFTTMWSLLGGTYHMTAETTESLTGDTMRAISQAAAGRYAEAGQKLAGIPLAPYRQARTSADLFNKAYYKGNFIGPRTQVESAVELLVKAGATPGRGARYTPDINSGPGNFFGGWGKGAAALNLAETGAQLKGIRNPGEAVNTAFGLLGKGMNTIMHPMFNVYIPRLKTGAMLEQLSDFIAANADHPERFLDKAIEIAKSADDRLGEMNQSTLFWNKTLQHAANLLMISPGWEVGTVRAALGGAGSFLNNPKSLSITNPDFHPNAAWPFAFAIMTATTGSIYQFLKTGKMPEDVKDPFFPKTGGTAANSTQPERAILPGYNKDIYSWWHGLTGSEGLPRNASTMLYNKLSNVPRAVWDTMANKDWAGKQIYNPSDPLMQRMQQYLQYVTHESLRPIMAQQIAKTGVKGTNITVPEAAFGVRAAPKPIEDPAQSEAGIAKANKKAQDESKKFHQKYGG